MKKTIFMDKYPVYSVELKKDMVNANSVSEILEHFETKIKEHPIATMIAIFDHYSHTKKIDGEIMDGLFDAQNIVFCFGTAIPDTKMTAVRPRSIGICELEDKFMIEFMEVPKEELNAVLESWINELIIK